MSLRRIANLMRRTSRRQPPDSPAARMVTEQLRARGVRDERVLRVISNLDRRAFVNPELRGNAFEDRPLAIGYGQTISQPYIVGVMTELLEIQPDHRILEIGTGSAYQTAVLCGLASEIVTIERIPALVERARDRLRTVGISNAVVFEGDGSRGWPEKAPYDRILLTAAAREIHPELFDQLADGGVMVAPVGETLANSESSQVLTKWTRCRAKRNREEIMNVRFVPLVEEPG